MHIRRRLGHLLASLLGGSVLQLLFAAVAAACTNGSGFPH